MLRICAKLILVPLLAVTGCSSPSAPPKPAAVKPTLTEARRGFTTNLVRRDSHKEEPVDAPPDGDLLTVLYDIPAGKASAYLSPDPKDGVRHPAIIWIHGGLCNVIGDSAWADYPESNDQSGRAFRRAGVITMYPALRGGNGSDGVVEGFLGEVDDVLAAADYLAKQPFVDPNRIYLGGHSCGGTLVLLVAESSPRFRAVFAFGAAEDISGHDPKFVPADLSNPRESELRSPGYWLDTIRSPVFVLDGTHHTHEEALRRMSANTTNPQVHFHSIAGGDHGNILAPATRLIAEKILNDYGAVCGIAFSDEEMKKLLNKQP